MIPAADRRVLILAEEKGDAELARRLLQDAYPQARISTDPGRFSADVAQFKPEVVIAVFRTVEAACRHYFGLYRDCAAIHAIPHRTLLLCSEDEVREAYDLCRREQFDDYAMFWPTGRDEPRLPMSVASALRALDNVRAAGALTRMAPLGRQLALGMAQSGRALDSVQTAQTRTGIALDAFSHRMLESGLDDAVTVRDPVRMQQEFSRLGDESLHQPLADAARAMQPLRRWMSRLGTELAPPLEVAKALAERATHQRPMILVVDDDELIRNLLVQVLGTANYEVTAVASAVEALSLLRTQQPRLILMDIEMPDIDGIDATRRLKAIDSCAGIPVILLSGRSEKQVIIDGLSAGAAGFVVKPVEREVLLHKVAEKLGA